MADNRNSDAQKRPDVAAPRVTKNAGDAASFGMREYNDDLNPQIVSLLQDAALDPVPDGAKVAVKTALGMGATAEDLVDFYIPTIARDFGEQWCSDNASFARVTIGVSRLQMMLRELGTNWSGAHSKTTEQSSILLVVPKDVHHTLGAVVLSSQLRRMGLSVRLLLGGTPKDTAVNVQRCDYDAVFISASQSEKLEPLRLIVDAIKASTQHPPKIVIGGTILEVEPIEKVTALTGADYATRIPQEALRLCGLLSPTQDDARIKLGS